METIPPDGFESPRELATGEPVVGTAAEREVTELGDPTRRFVPGDQARAALNHRPPARGLLEDLRETGGDLPA